MVNGINWLFEVRIVCQVCRWPVLANMKPTWLDSSSVECVRICMSPSTQLVNMVATNSHRARLCKQFKSNLSRFYFLQHT